MTPSLRNRLALWILGIGGLCLCATLLPTVRARPAPPVSSSPPANPDLLGLRKDELARALARLVQAKDVRALRELVTNPDTAPLAASSYVRLLSAEQAVAFCTSLELGSGAWVSAFNGLTSHEKEKVIGYIKQLATSQVAEVRYLCYRVCEINRWNDLSTSATKDRDDESEVTFHCSPPSETIGKAARAYLEVCPVAPK